MRLRVDRQQFIIEPETDADRAFMLMLHQEVGTVSTSWGMTETQPPDTALSIMPVMVIEWTTKSEEMEGNK